MVIQLIDIVEATLFLPLHLLIEQYVWEGQETGGQYEAQKVMSVLPGLGMLANGHRTLHNIYMGKPNIDESGILRYHSPNAGAITHYSNLYLSYSSSKNVTM